MPNPHRIEATWAASAADFTRLLHRLHTRWDGAVVPIDTGYAILAGPGLYVNRGVGVGLDGPVAPAAFDTLESASAKVGVPAAIEITPFSDPTVQSIAEQRGYREETVRTVFAMEPTNGGASVGGPCIRVAEVTDDDALRQWQAVAAVAFSADSELGRAASDAYAATSFASDDDRLFLAFDGREEAVACCALIVRDRMATLGGMGVVPAARGQGIQRAMIDARIAIARLVGADLVVSSAVSEVSTQNLAACGFARLYEQRTWVRA